MIRVLGNSSERVPIKDLNDCIYYKQQKEYSDTEYASSKDLKKALETGRIVKLEQVPSPRASVDGQGQGNNGSNSSISISDIRAVLREIVPQEGMSEDKIRNAMMEFAPLIVSMVRQEFSKISVQGPGATPVQRTEFVGPEYVPTVTTEGMMSSIEAKTSETSDDDTMSALQALKALQGIK
jgi:hypothetical protein